MHESTPLVVERKRSFIRLTALLIPLVIVMVMLSQTVFARNTYVITDGEKVMIYTSAATDPAAVLSEAGLALGADDTFTTQSGIGISEITVTRNRDVTVDFCGEMLALSSSHETVEALLQELNITLTENMRVSAPLDAEIYDGMYIDISETVRQTQTYTTTIPYKTTYCYDDTLPQGTETVLTEGVEGQMLCTAEVVYVDAVEQNRTLLTKKVTVQPVDCVIAVGTGTVVEDRNQQSVVIGENTITLPSGEVLTYTGTTQVVATAYTHTDAGCDFITATGTTVRIGTVAVDPRLIPYGTRMFIVANDGSYIYGVSTAEDCGGSIKGDRVDLYYPTYGECIQFGVRDCTIYFLG